MPEREKLRNYHAAKRNSIGHLSCFLVFFLCSARLKDPNEMSAVFCPVTLLFPLKQDVLSGTYSSLPSLFNSQYASFSPDDIGGRELFIRENISLDKKSYKVYSNV